MSSSKSGLDAIELPPAVRQGLMQVRKARKTISPYLPMACRVLLVSTFIEDGIRILFEMSHQIDFLHHEYSIPRFLAGLMLFANILISFAAIILILARKRIARGTHETHAAYALIACVAYQQILYGRHSPIGSGNIGFLIRNLCLSGSLLLISCQSRIASGRSALPMGLLDGPTDKKSAVAYMQLASRIMLVMLGVEVITMMKAVGILIGVPAIIAVLVGYQLEISGGILLMVYFLHNVTNSAFWTVQGTYIAQIMQYE